jgi:uncharacterized damage-inducible protein DinB
MTNEITEIFLASSRRTLTTWLERIEKCVGQLTPEQIWWRGQENSNAIGNLMLHLSGNVRQWIISGVGGTPDTRNRGAEFAQREPMTIEELLRRLRATVEEACDVLSRAGSQDLTEKRHIQRWEITLLEAVHHSTEHFALHAGQILYATKLLTGSDLGFYGALSKPLPKTATAPKETL